MTDSLHWHEERPTLHEPLLVAMLTGWIDASSAAAGAMTLLDAACDARPLVTFDGDQFIDYRARRPTMMLRAESATQPSIDTAMSRLRRSPSRRT